MKPDCGSSTKMRIDGFVIDLSKICYISPIYTLANLEFYTLVMEGNVELKLSNAPDSLHYFKREDLITLWMNI